MRANRIVLDRIKHPCKCQFETLLNNVKIKVRYNGCNIHDPNKNNLKWDIQEFKNNIRLSSNTIQQESRLYLYLK